MWRIDDYCAHCDSSVLFFSQVVTKLSNMTSNEHTEPKRSVYDTCDPQYLRGLREAAGMDVFVLARTACLSVAQVRQLESDDSDGLFYSDAIKRQAYKRLLMILGAEPPTVEVPEDLRDAGKVAEAHLNTLDQIVAMSHLPSMNRSALSILGAGFHKLKAHKQMLGALLLLVVAVVLFVLQGPQHSEEAVAIPAATSAATNPVPKLPLVVEQPVVTAAAVPVLVASAPVAPVPVVAASSGVLSQPASCAYSSDAMPEVTPLIAVKEGRYVYLVSGANVDLCVVDGNKQATAVQLKAGENRSVYGVSPWQVSSAQLPKVQIYFQGGRVSLPDGNAHRVKVLEVAVTR